MKLKLATVAVAMLVLTTGVVVATPGNAPDGAQAADHAHGDDRAQGDDHATDGDRPQTDAASDRSIENGSADAAERRGLPADVGGGDGPAAVGGQGPPADLPEQVPDFVTEIHDLVREHADGALSGADLGSAISDVTPDDEANETAA